ncbi:50S ribosomal protein L4 [candidate division GN15 bacterium]|uniref:Large ribosomal subunit protein uL4 n=1 Tax=candidate division GN15 bacterium TaxID=2072418 RepID=A0A855X4M5_9BACT|nr:MAG: 50S ribosomal protein L4 [candidate division GN15 bacterium]
MKVKVYNQDGAEVGSVDLKPEIFEIEPNEAVVHQYVVNYLARQRQGTVKTKGRSEVSGGGKKPWRQKGTGRARSGTIRSPLWRGGGTVFGPQPRSYGSNFPKQMKRLAIRSVLSSKAKENQIKVLDQISFDAPKTKNVTGMLGKLELTGRKCLILDEGRNDKMTLSCRNLRKVTYGRAALANGYDLLNADVIVLTKAGLEKVHEVLA